MKENNNKNITNNDNKFVDNACDISQNSEVDSALKQKEFCNGSSLVVENEKQNTQVSSFDNEQSSSSLEQKNSTINDTQSVENDNIVEEVICDKNGNDKRSGLFNIVLLGLVSMFIDMSTEMVYPIMPLFLVAIGTKPSIIGIIEGISESIAAFLRVGSGYVSDKTDKKKSLTIIGYSACFFYKICILLSTTWVGILFGKIVDRTGKGIRTAPRDSLIAESGGKSLGKAYGLHKMFDKIGASLGVLLAYVIMLTNPNYRSVFVWSIIPAVLGVIILYFVKEVKRKQTLSKENFSLKNIKLGAKLWLYIVTVFIFSIGNSSNAFLLLKAQATGIDDVNILLVYLAFNLTASILAIPFGKLSDKIDRKWIIFASYFLYAIVYFCFTIATNKYSMLGLFIIYGLYAAMLPGAEKALAIELSPKHLKGTVLGLQGMAQGFGLLVSSIIAGLLWDYAGNNFPFYFGAIMAFIASIMLLFVLGKKKNTVVVA